MNLTRSSGDNFPMGLQDPFLRLIHSLTKFLSKLLQAAILQQSLCSNHRFRILLPKNDLLCCFHVPSLPSRHPPRNLQSPCVNSVAGCWIGAAFPHVFPLS